MARWSYLIPRLIILGLVVVAVWIGSEPILKYALEKSGEDAIGAKVEIGKVRTAIRTGKVYLKDLQIADPRNPMLNMVQADMAYIQLDPRLLLQREIVVENGTTSKIKFGVPRTASGKLDRNLAQSETIHPTTAVEAQSSNSDLSQTWLDGFQSTVPQTSEEDLETVSLARQFKAKWLPQFETKREQITSVQNQIKLLRKIVISKDNSNPLRTQRIQAAFNDMELMHQKIVQLQNSLVQLQKEALADRDSLLRAKRRDEEKIRQQVTANQIDSQTVSQLLLKESQTEYVNEVLRWFRWFQSTIPDPDNDFCPIPKRGTDVVFKGIKASPRLLIKSLEIDGEGHLAGQHLNFVGTANNLSSRPDLHDEPISFHLRALGKQHLIVDCVLDRRSEVVSDTLNVQCPDLNIEAQMLGSKNTILVAMGPSHMQAEIAIRINDDQLSGELVFRNSEVLMHVDDIHPLAGGQATALKINQDLASVDTFQTYVQLSGTLQKPEFEFRSDLGNKFATTMNRLAIEQVNRNAEHYKLRLAQILNEEIEQLDLTIQKNLRALATILTGESETISQLKEIMPKERSAWNRQR